MSNINIRIREQQKKEVRTVLDRLGIDMSTAIKMYLQQIILHQGLPFSVALQQNVPRGTKELDQYDGTPGKDFIGIGCGVLILNDKKQILLMRRTLKTRNDHGKWSIPGGKVELGERVQDTIIREVQEECNITLVNPYSIGYVDHFIETDNHHWVSMIFVAEGFSGDIINLEPEKCDAIEWFSLDQIPEKSSEVVFKAKELLECSTWNS